MGCSMNAFVQKWQFQCEKCESYLTHRIHGAATYGNIYHPYTPNVSIYIYHTWILWVIIWNWRYPKFIEKSPSTNRDDAVNQTHQHGHLRTPGFTPFFGGYLNAYIIYHYRTIDILNI